MAKNDGDNRRKRETAALAIGGGLAPVIVRVNPRARRIIVRVDKVMAHVIVTVPSHRARAEGLAFAESRRDWIAAELGDATGPRPFNDGVVFPLQGRSCRIDHVGGRARARLRDDVDAMVLNVGGESVHVNRRVGDWLRRRARRILTEKAGVYAMKVGRTHGRITIRDTRSRWGSCSRDGGLSFSWRLVLTPPAILDYVAAHECAHLVHLDHSPAYWRLVRSLDVDPDGARRWFRENGAALFAWGVAPTRGPAV